jgi:hypothetical protein
MDASSEFISVAKIIIRSRLIDLRQEERVRNEWPNFLAVANHSRTIPLISEGMNQAELCSLADAWINYWHAPKGSPGREINAWAADLYDLEHNEPEMLWLLILEIHRRDQSAAIQEVLSAGPIEDLLTKHGENFIDRVQAEARKDPLFAKVLGGVWQNRMSDAVWKRLQSVWDRRGWDGIPE